jgi:hypothetical protein
MSPGGRGYHALGASLANRDIPQGCSSVDAISQLSNIRKADDAFESSHRLIR